MQKSRKISVKVVEKIWESVVGMITYFSSLFEVSTGLVALYKAITEN